MTTPTHNPWQECPQIRGERVQLVALQEDDLDALCDVGLEPSIWKWNVQRMETREDMEAYVAAALQEQQNGQSLPFTIRVIEHDLIVGSTRFGAMSPEHRRVEIGWTWVIPAWQRTFVNTETKLLMLTYAFETLGCIRVELKTDTLNHQSRNAMLRLGARQEATLRAHMLTHTGRRRDTIYFSILDEEWPVVKTGLQESLARGVSGSE